MPDPVLANELVSIALQDSPSFWALATGPMGGIALFCLLFGMASGAFLTKRYVFKDKLAILEKHHEVEQSLKNEIFTTKLKALEDAISHLADENTGLKEKVVRLEAKLEAKFDHPRGVPHVASPV